MCQLSESAMPARLWELNAQAEQTHWEEAFFF